ncbi:MAG TPA: SPOR domain-containing protein [Gemmatimonadales bacterium]|nr:SPOR domain-containing protein [Gemmatimonadales bacterium]
MLLGAACERETKLSLGKVPAVTQGPAPSSALRMPPGGGVPRLYRLPTLSPSSWAIEDKLPAIERPIGADAEQGLVYVLDGKRNVVALDLETRRVRTSLDQIRYAAVGPDGALYTVDTGSTVTQLVRRAPVRFRSKLQGTPAELYATMSGAVLARLTGPAPVLEALGSDQAPTSTTLPSGPLATSLYGDLVAVAADTAVVLYAPLGKTRPLSLPVSGHARAAVFSPSGHRVYVAQQDHQLLVFDRFSGARIQTIDLPGGARGLRGDQYGQWLMVRPDSGDSAWVIDIGRARRTGTVATKWAADLPAVASPNTLLAREGKDVIGRDLGKTGFPETGRVADGADDFWLVIGWRPAQDVETVSASDSAAVAAAADSQAAPSVYLQVSSSQNPSWANELSDKLRAAGLPASVLPPKRSDEAYRVVLGPYASRDQAEETGRKIGMPSFVVTAQDEAAQ